MPFICNIHKASGDPCLIFRTPLLIGTREYIILQLQLVAVESYLLILNHCKVLIKILQKKDYIHPQLGMKTRLIPIKHHTFIYYSKSLAINKILQQKVMI